MSIALPHETEMWLAAYWAVRLARGDVLALDERWAESAELAVRTGLVEGAGSEAKVLEVFEFYRRPHGFPHRVIPNADHRLAGAERAFRSLWESRERRKASEVTEAEAQAAQRSALRLMPGGATTPPRDIEAELAAVGW